MHNLHSFSIARRNRAPVRCLSTAIAAACLTSMAPAAWAINGSGTWVISKVVGDTATGTFTTPQGDTGTFTLQRTASSGYRGDPVFTAPTTGLIAQSLSCYKRTDNPSPADANNVCDQSGGDTFSYSLTLSSNSGAPLVTEVVQGMRTAATENGNSEAARLTMSFGGSGYVALNPAVTLHATSGSVPAGTTTPQVRKAGNSPLPYNTDNSTNYPAYAAGEPLSSGTAVQLFGVGNANSGYRYDLVGADGVSLTYSANMNGNYATNIAGVWSATGETFNEWIGFGVRNLPVATDDAFPAVTQSAGGTTTGVLTNDRFGAAPPVVSGANANATLTPGTAPAPASGSITMNADGTITIAPSTSPGTYQYPYTVCASPASASPQPAYECVSATATVTVLPPPSPQNDSIGPISTGAGGSAPSVLSNDTLGDGAKPVLGSGGNATLTWAAGNPPISGITLNPDGTVTVAPGTQPGAYPFTYELCDTRTTPAQCKTAVATVTVSPLAPVPVGPWWLLVPPVMLAGARKLRRRGLQR